MNKAKPLHIYNAKETRTKLEKLAAAHHRTMSAEVRYLIDVAYEELEQKTKLLKG